MSLPPDRRLRALQGPHVLRWGDTNLKIQLISIEFTFRSLWSKEQITSHTSRVTHHASHINRLQVSVDPHDQQRAQRLTRAVEVVLGSRMVAGPRDDSHEVKVGGWSEMWPRITCNAMQHMTHASQDTCIT